MTDLAADIRALDDETAQAILSKLSRQLPSPPAAATTLTPELADKLTAAVGETPADATTYGELARLTLLLLVDDPARQAEIQAAVANLPTALYRFDPLTALTLGTVALLALQSHLKIEYDKDGGWRFKLEKQPADKTLLRQMVGLLKSMFVSGK